MTPSITYSLVTLTTDGKTSILQLMAFQNIRKNTLLAQARLTGNSNALFKDGGTVIGSEVFVHIFNLFVC